MAFISSRIFIFLLGSFLFGVATCTAQTAGPPFTGARTRNIEGNLSGAVQDALGRPLSDATVTLTSQDGKKISSTTTDEHGHFSLEEPASGSYVLTAERTGFNPATTMVILPQPAGKRIELTLESRQALTLPVSARGVSVQNGISRTGTNKYVLTSKDIANLPAGADRLGGQRRRLRSPCPHRSGARG